MSMQLEYKNTVTVHLRGRRAGGTAETAATFIRAFSRLYSRVTGTPLNAYTPRDSHQQRSVLSDCGIMVHASGWVVCFLCSSIEQHCVW